MSKKMRFCTYCNQNVQAKKSYSACWIIILIISGVPGWIFLLFYLIFKKPNKCPICRQKKFLTPIAVPTEIAQHSQSPVAIAHTSQIPLTISEKTCPTCGTLVNSSFSFCVNCGQDLKMLNQSTTSGNRCKNCGNMLDKEPSNFCKYCGQKLT